MYVIGRSKGDYIRLVNSKGIEYSHSINLASIFTSLEKAELMIDYIKENIDSLYFANATILGNIIDKEKNFDKVTYVNELKIYELVPTEVKHVKIGQGWHGGRRYENCNVPSDPRKAWARRIHLYKLRTSNVFYKGWDGVSWCLCPACF